MTQMPQTEKIKGAIQKLKDKDFNIYFFTMDSKGNPIASINTIYTWAKYLKELGYKPIILHEKNDYVKPDKWIGKTEYDENLEHKSVESKTVNMFPHDFLIIPEIFANVMEQSKNIPAKRIVLCQSYDHVLEFIKPGESWLNYGIRDCITTCESQKKYLQYLFPTTNVNVVNISIPEYFNKPIKPKKPIFAIHTREPRNASREEFANGLKECCGAIWDDKLTGFGTFPLEAFKTGTPLIGTKPTIMPDWFDEKSGVWVNETIDIPDAIGKFLSGWLEDILPDDLVSVPEKYQTMYKSEDEKNQLAKYFEGQVTERIEEFNSAIEEIEKQVNPTNNNPEVINLFE
jgi:hypothetical protein